MVLYLTTLAFKPCLTSLWNILFVRCQKVSEVCLITIAHDDLTNYSQLFMYLCTPRDSPLYNLFILLRCISVNLFFVIQCSMQKLADQPWILTMGLLLNVVYIEMLKQVRVMLEC